MDECYEICTDDDVFTVLDLKNIPPPLDETSNEEEIIFTMTSLGNLILGQHRTDNRANRGTNDDDDLQLSRLSLAYERLHTMPKILLQELAASIRILDISNNDFANLDFLEEFTELQSLICDHNKITSDTHIPYMPKLELLWVNHCRISDLTRFVRRLQYSCPNLKYLSMMGNPATPSYLNGGNFYEYLQNRFFIIALFPNLVHLDDQCVTSDQKSQAQKIFQQPVLQRLLNSTQKTLPKYVRSFIGKCTYALTPPSSFSERNGIV